MQCQHKANCFSHHFKVSAGQFFPLLAGLDELPEDELLPELLLEEDDEGE